MSWPDVVVNVLDVLLVTYLVYRLLLLVRGTRAWRILGGIVIFLLVLTISDALHLNTLHWLLDKATPLGPVALVILLLPELRQAIEQLGRVGFWPQKLGGVEERADARTIEEIVAATAELAAQRVGALIVVEKGSPMEEIAANGVMLNARISASLLGSIFFGKNPLHDGAVLVRGDNLVAAACRLPLSESARLDQTVHMRHRAAVGVTEGIDCVAVVVSEERGTISVATEGRLLKLSGPGELRDILNAELRNIHKPVDNLKPRKEKVRRGVPVK